MSVRAKFVCNHNDGNHVVLNPVYSPDKTTENYQFWNATPSGSLNMYLQNQNAIDQFIVGREYYIDFTPVE